MILSCSFAFKHRKPRKCVHGYGYLPIKNNKYLIYATIGFLFSECRITNTHQKLGEDYRLKELLTDFWGIEEKADADGYLAYWYYIVQDSPIPAFQKLIKTRKEHEDIEMLRILSIFNIESKVNCQNHNSYPKCAHQRPNKRNILFLCAHQRPIFCVHVCGLII